jgi:hypothetical protein
LVKEQFKGMEITDYLQRAARHNHEQSKNYAAGVLPICVGDEDDTPYFLLGLQHHNALVKGVAGMLKEEWGNKLDKTEGWCIFWGWQDLGDLSVEDSAAREAFEESLGVLGHTSPTHSLVCVLMTFHRKPGIFA